MVGYPFIIHDDLDHSLTLPISPNLVIGTTYPR